MSDTACNLGVYMKTNIVFGSVVLFLDVQAVEL